MANAKRSNKPKRPNNRGAAVHATEEAVAAVNRDRALQMRIMGLSIREIAKTLGVAVSTAHAYIAAELAEIRASTAQKREQLREIERARLEAVLARWLPIAMHESLDVSKDVEGPNGQPKHIELDDYMAGTKAGELVVKISARLSALDGLDAPVKQEIGSVGDFDTASKIRARMAARKKV